MNMEVINDRRIFIFSKSSRTQFVPPVDRLGKEHMLMELKIFIFNIGENRKRDDFFFPSMGDIFVLFCYSQQYILAICTWFR